MVAADPIVLVPGSPEWQRELTASKVAAILGLSPWDSRYSMWFKMAGLTEAEPPTAEQEGGHYLEPAVCAWLADEYGLRLAPGGCWRNRERTWQVASPDRLARDQNDGHVDPPTSVVEVKTSRSWEKHLWGPDGSDDIPPYYRAQVVWQCDTLGLPRGYVGVLLPNLEFRGYVIEPTPGEVEFIREECQAFLDTLREGVPPDVDAHSETYRTIRAQHPGLNGETVPVPYELARDYVAAVAARKAAEAEELLQNSRLAQHMGDASRAEYDGQKIAHRQTNGRGSPYVKPAKDLPVIELPEE